MLIDLLQSSQACEQGAKTFEDVPGMEVKTTFEDRMTRKKRKQTKEAAEGKDA